MYRVDGVPVYVAWVASIVGMISIVVSHGRSFLSMLRGDEDSQIHRYLQLNIANQSVLIPNTAAPFISKILCDKNDCSSIFHYSKGKNRMDFFVNI